MLRSAELQNQPFFRLARELLPGRRVTKRFGWLILLRRIAIVCLFGVITISHFVLGLDLPIRQLYLGNLALLASNIAYALYLRSKRFERVNILINVQIFLDLLLLTYLLYYSGGIANPFFLFFMPGP